MDNSPYYTKKDIFYYIEVFSKIGKRDDKFASLLDVSPNRLYIGSDVCSGDKYSLVSELKYSRFFKERRAVNDFIYRNKTDDILKVLDMSAIEFISVIPYKYDIDNFLTIRNIKMRFDMVRSIEIWSEHRKKYKATPIYKRVSKPNDWLPCGECGLIPLEWEFNNGRSTACGCGKDEYTHHTIQAESIMSYIQRNNGSAANYVSNELMDNWNIWVKSKIDIFKKQKETNPNIW